MSKSPIWRQVPTTTVHTIYVTWVQPGARMSIGILEKNTRKIVCIYRFPVTLSRHE